MDMDLNTPTISHTNINQNSSLLKNQHQKKDYDFGLIQLVKEREKHLNHKKAYMLSKL